MGLTFPSSLVKVQQLQQCLPWFPVFFCCLLWCCRPKVTFFLKRIQFSQKLEMVLFHSASQFELTMNKIKESLKENGATWDDVIKTTIMLKDIKDYKQMNDIYKTFFKTNYPARSAYQVAALPLGAEVEVEVIAFVQ